MKIQSRSLLLFFILGLFQFTVFSVCSFADDKPPAGAPAFRIVEERSGNGHRQVIRFNSKTGEAWYNWTTVAPEWVKIAETGPVPAGDYEVLLMPGTTNDSNWGLRFDRLTGRTWNFGPNGWAEFKEPEIKETK